MIDLYLWILVMLLVSVGTRAIYRRAHTPGFKTAFDIIMFIGVIVHEISHYTLGILFGTKMGKIRVNYRGEGSDGIRKVSPHGSVDSPEFERNSFMQTFMISFAPLFVSTFLFMFGLDIIFHIQTEIWVKVIAVVFCFSLLIGSSPSRQDVRLVGVTFNRNPRYSLYQLFLVFFSGILVWIHIDFNLTSLPFEVLDYILYFIFVALFYYVLKLGFWGLGKLISITRTKFGKGEVSSPKFLTRRRRFKEYKKQKEKEAQW
jgi:hypothetical protein